MTDSNQDHREDFHPQGRAATSITHSPDLDQIAWRQFAEATSPEAFYHAWLTLQARMIHGVFGGVVVLGPPEKGPFAPAAFWPEKRGITKHLAEVAERALTEHRGLVIPGEAEGSGDAPTRARLGVAYPIHAAGRLHGVVAFEIRPRPEPDSRLFCASSNGGPPGSRSSGSGKNTHAARPSRSGCRPSSI